MMELEMVEMEIEMVEVVECHEEDNSVLGLIHLDRVKYPETCWMLMLMLLQV